MLTTVSNLKEYLPEISGTVLDTELTRLITRVESAIAGYLGFTLPNSSTNLTLDESTYTLYVDHPLFLNSEVLQLPLRPLVSITSVHSDINRNYGTDDLIDSSKYELDKENSRIILKDTSPDNFERGYRANKIVGTFGYSTSSPPADLVHAICVWCSHLQRAKNSQGNNSITQRNSTISLSPRTMPPEVREILRRFRNASAIF